MSINRTAVRLAQSDSLVSPPAVRTTSETVPTLTAVSKCPAVARAMGSSMIPTTTN